MLFQLLKELITELREARQEITYELKRNTYEQQRMNNALPIFKSQMSHHEHVKQMKEEENAFMQRTLDSISKRRRAS